VIEYTSFQAPKLQNPWYFNPEYLRDLTFLVMKKQFTKRLAPTLARCKLNVNQEERMTMHQKVNVLIFFNIYMPKEGIFAKSQV
jgi:hypothetical protein